MKCVYIIVDGSNDLYQPLSVNLSNLIYKTNFNNDIKVYILYSIEKCIMDELWYHKIDNEQQDNLRCINGKGACIIENGIKKDIDSTLFFRKTIVNNKTINIIAPDIFLETYLNNNNINIVIISGHGGPFQSLLDMSVSPMVSINTVLLCKRINKFNIEYLFLDMCAMNYIETLYEILYKKNIKNIITYGDSCPFYGVYYSDFIRSISLYYEDKMNDFYKFIRSSGMIIITQKNIKDIEDIRDLQCTIVKKIITEKNPDFDIIIDDINKYLANISNSLDNHIKSNRRVDYIKFYLTNEGERKLYTQYEITKNNLWRFIITKKCEIYDDFNPECIILDKSSIENLIYIHNSTLCQDEINKKVNKLISSRNEEDIYN